MRIFVFLAIFLLPLGSSLAQETDPASDILGRVFTEVERQVIEDYYRGRGHGELGDENEDVYEEVRATGKRKGKGHGKKDGLPPGLAKRDELPPGLEKQLERNGRLPPGLEKRRLPGDLYDDLGDFEDGTEPQVVGTDVLLVETATGVILDILRDVIPTGG